METEKKRDCEETQSGEEEVIFCLSLPADTQPVSHGAGIPGMSRMG